MSWARCKHKIRTNKKASGRVEVKKAREITQEEKGEYS
jgi:hypothetical protein